MSSVFDERACDIVNSILNTKIPSPIRGLMQGVLSSHNGTFRTYLPSHELHGSNWCDVRPLTSVSGTLLQLKWFVQLAHQVHVHAHLSIEMCIQRCLQSPLGQQKHPENFETPSWTEEQRSLIGFWRLIFLNQLRINGQKRSLKWTAQVMYSLNDGGLNYNHPFTHTIQTLMALDYITGFFLLSQEEKQNVSSNPLNLPPIPKDREFGFDCQSPPSWQSVNQRPSQISSPRAQGAAFFGPSSNSSEDASDLDEYDYMQSDDNGEDESSDKEDEEDDDGNERTLTGAFSCILRDTSDSDSDRNDREYEYPNKLQVLRYPIIPWKTRPIRDYGPMAKRVDESLDLGREPLGLQFYRSMAENQEGGPGKYMSPFAYIRYGFGLWEEQRFIELGLWSNDLIEDMHEYYKTWFQFLSPDDMVFHRKFRYATDEDYL
ncbi:hypothetical protein N7456_002471 [Penicillium angulare]|uniref:Uncharacterized protein n=1 Tax=Penicillium angulare TaxID=116970 RepID=A0A9W9G8H1_9EURO|nr:hypothetical protein N7456_002471 [Penicillium angulare]